MALSEQQKQLLQDPQFREAVKQKLDEISDHTRSSSWAPVKESIKSIPKDFLLNSLFAAATTPLMLMRKIPGRPKIGTPGHARLTGKGGIPQSAVDNLPSRHWFDPRSYRGRTSKMINAGSVMTRRGPITDEAQRTNRRRLSDKNQAALRRLYFAKLAPNIIGGSAAMSVVNPVQTFFSEHASRSQNMSDKRKERYVDMFSRNPELLSYDPGTLYSMYNKDPKHTNALGRLGISVKENLPGTVAGLAAFGPIGALASYPIQRGLTKNIRPLQLLDKEKTMMKTTYDSLKNYMYDDVVKTFPMAAPMQLGIGGIGTLMGAAPADI